MRQAPDDADEDATTMIFRVPYISDDAIERDAEALLAQYAYATGVEIRAPIPIEDILEKYLKFTLEFNDMHRMFGIPRVRKSDTDILGAVFFDEHRIVIDETLDPDENAYKEGRFRFTLAHECGHCRLHRGADQRAACHRECGRPALCPASRRAAGLRACHR